MGGYSTGRLRKEGEANDCGNDESKSKLQVENNMPVAWEALFCVLESRVSRVSRVSRGRHLGDVL